MKKQDQLAIDSSILARRVVMGLVVILGIAAAGVAGFLFYIMNVAGLMAFMGFLLSIAVAIGCAGALLIYIKEGDWIN